MREQALLQTTDENHVEFQALRGMHRHQLHRLIAFTSLMLARFQRSQRQERNQRPALTDRAFVIHKSSGSVDQLIKIFQSILAFFLFLFHSVMLRQTAFLNQVLDNFRQRQSRGLLTQRLNQPDEGAHRLPGLASQRSRRVVKTGIQLVRGSLQIFQRTRTDPTGGEINDAQEGGVVIRIAEQAQIGQRMLDLLALEEAQAAINLVGNILGKQFVFEHPRLRIRAVENRHLRRRNAVAHQLTDFINDKTRFVEIGISFKGTDRLAIARIGPQIFTQTLTIIFDQCIRRRQNIAVRTIVLLQPDNVLTGVVTLEIPHVADLGTAKTVNTLIVVTHGKNLGTTARE